MKCFCFNISHFIVPSYSATRLINLQMTHSESCGGNLQFHYVLFSLHEVGREFLSSRLTTIINYFKPHWQISSTRKRLEHLYLYWHDIYAGHGSIFLYLNSSPLPSFFHRFHAIIKTVRYCRKQKKKNSKEDLGLSLFYQSKIVLVFVLALILQIMYTSYCYLYCYWHL